MGNRQSYSKKDVSFSSLGFEQWLIDALKKQGLSIHSFCIQHNLNYNTIYSRVKGCVNDSDIEFFSRLLNDYTFIERVLEDLEMNISKIDKEGSMKDE